jgi:ABC-type multidrug transport system fused ATPase/permease subunit
VLSAPASPDVLPKVVFFSLLVLVVLFLCLAVVVVVTPNLLSTKTPDDLLNNRLMGLFGGLMFTVIALGLGGTAFAVFRMYLRKRS